MPALDHGALAGLRVGVIGPQYPDSFASQLAAAVGSLGATAVALGSAVPRSTRPALHRFLSLAATASPVLEQWQCRLASRCNDLDLIVTVEASLLPPIVQRLRARAGHVVLWFPDHVSNLGRFLPFVSDYSLLCFKEPRLVERAAALFGSPVRLLPEACDPAVHCPPSTEPEVNRTIIVAGNFYPWRVALLERLAAAEIPLRLYGPSVPPWLTTSLRPAHTGEYLSGQRRAVVFRGACAVLNNLHPAEIDGVNARIFEGAGCGALLLTENRPMLSSLFEVGKEVLSFSAFDELVDTCRWALAHPVEGREIGAAASLRAHRDHTYQHRLTTMLSWLE